MALVQSQILTFISGADLYHNTALDSTITAVQTASSALYIIEVNNTANASEDNYLKLWNVATGSVTVGTTVPDWVIRVPQGKTVTVMMPDGITFDTAISAACVTTAGTGGTTNPTASVIVKLMSA